MTTPNNSCPTSRSEPGRQMSTGLSIWWATPSDPAHHFSDEELLASDRYHRPIRFAGLLATAAKVGLLLVATWLVAGPFAAAGSGSGAGSATGGSAADWLVDAGFFEVLTGRSLLIGAGLTAAALRLPAIAVDAWFEYRFRHGTGPSDGFLPVQKDRFAATVVLLWLLLWSGLMVVGAVIYPIVARTGAWPLLLSAAVVVVVVAAAVVEWPIRRRLPGRAEPMHTGNDGFAQLAERFGMSGVPVMVGAQASATAPVARHHFNAASMGLGRNRRIVVTDALLAEPDAVQDFVVAHELSHLRRRHLLGQTAMVATLAVVSILVLAAVAGIDWPRASLGIDLVDPMHLPAVVLLLLALGVVTGPAVAWVGRAQERVADADAIAVVGPLPVGLARGLHAQANTDLDPPRWIRAFAQHPSPAERLEFAERHRRAI